MNYFSFLSFLFVLIFFQNGKSFNNRILLEKDTTLAVEYFQQALILEDSALIDSAISLNIKAINELTVDNNLDSELDNQRFDYQINLIELYKNNNNYSAADNLVDKILENCKDSIRLASLYFSKCEIFQNKQELDSALVFCKKAESFKSNLKILREIGRIYIYTGRFDLAKYYHERAIERLETDTIKDIEFTASLYVGIGVAYGYDGYYQEARKNYRKAYEIVQNNLGKNHSYNYSILLNFGVVEEKLGNYYKALEYYQGAALLNKKLKGEANPFLAYCHNNIGIVYERLGKDKRAEEEFNEAIRIVSITNPNNHLDKVDYKLNLGIIYLKTERYDKAIKILLPNLDTIKLKVGKKHINIGRSLTTLAECYERIGAVKKAENFYNESATFIRNNLGKRHPELCKMLNGLGTIQFKLGKHKTALLSFQEALWIQDSTCNSKDLNENPKGLNVIEPLTLLTTLDKKAYSLYQLFRRNSSNTELLEQSYKAYLPLLKLGEKTLRSFDREASKLNLLQLIQEINGRAVTVCVDYLKQNYHHSIEENLFAFIENSRASVLQEALFAKKVKVSSAIPENIILTGRELKLKINELKYQQIQLDIDALSLDKTNEALTELNLRYDSLWNKVALDFPDYQFALNKQKNARLNDVKAKLQADETMIDYFLTDSILFTLVITSNSFKVKKQTLSRPLKETINKFYQNLYEYHLSKEQTEMDYENNLKSLASTGHDLFRILIEPLEELSETLIIIPDGEMGYIPFDILLTKLPNIQDNFREWAFLINKYQISYNYSVQLWLGINNNRNNQGELLAFAPYFSEDKNSFIDINQIRREGLGKLIYNQKEIESINNTFGGTSLINQQATAKQFYERAPTASILHLATHAKLDDENIDYSWLALQPSKDSLVADKIYIKDLYNMNLSAEMVVLSACETGFGALKKGEGIFSLARGFTYAGAKSIITSLWSVNDKSTFVLMDNFYKQLKQGVSKDDALRKAKLDYISTVDNYHAHPFFWASFIGIGDMTPVKLNNRTTLSSVLVGIIGLFLLLFLFIGRKKIDFS